MVNIKTLEKKKRPWVIAHRGYRSACPENTISAFESAIDVKADMIELDVCLTRDRVPVVIHDTTLERTTDGKGLVSEYTLSELKELDAGSWFSSEFKGESIPTLEETLDQIRGRITINIEIKPENFESSAPSDSVEIQICKLVEKFDMVNSILISSFNHSFFSRIHSFYSKYKQSNLPRIAPIQGVFKSEDVVIDLCQREKAYSYHPNESFVTVSLIEELKACGYRIFPYTINDKKRMEHLIQMGVHGIISDEPEKLWEVIKNFSRKNF